MHSDYLHQHADLLCVHFPVTRVTETPLHGTTFQSAVTLGCVKASSFLAKGKAKKKINKESCHMGLSKKSVLLDWAASKMETIIVSAV